MPTLTELETGLKVSRKSEKEAREAWTAAGKPKDGPEKADLMRAAKTTKELERSIDEQEMRARISVGREEPVYRPDGKVSFFRDIKDSRRSVEARERLERNERQVSKRITGDTQGEGFEAPAFLSEFWADAPRAQRVVPEIIRRVPMPPKGFSGELPRFDTGLEVGAVTKTSGVNNNVTDSDMASSVVTSNLATVAGSTDVDRLIVDRVTGFDAVLFSDLTAAYDAELDRQLIAGQTSAQELKGLLLASGTNTFDASGASTGSTLFTDVYKAVSKHYEARHRMPTHALVNPAVWLWLSSTLATSLPLLQQGGPVANNFGGITWAPDDNVPNIGSGTGNGAIVLLTAEDPVYAESGPLRFKYNDVLSNTLTSRFQVFSYCYAWPERRPEGVTVLTGIPEPSGF